MPWWKDSDDKLPEQLRNMKPEDIVAAVEKSKKVDQLETDLNAAKGQISQVETLKQQIASLEHRVPAQQQQQQQQQQGPVSFIENEDLAFNQRLAPFAVTTMQNMARQAKFQAKMSLSGPRLKMWDKYEAEIDEVMKGVDLSFQGTPETWIKALNSVIGNHVDDITKFAQAGTEFFAETNAGGGGGGPKDTPLDTDVITDEDKKIMARFGLTEDQYKASKKEMVVRNV